MAPALYLPRAAVPVASSEEKLLQTAAARARVRRHTLGAFRWRTTEERWATACVVCRAWVFVAPDTTKTRQSVHLSGMALGLACRGRKYTT